MTINQIQLANTFDVWRIATNDLISIANDLVEGNLQTSGTVSLTNPSGFQNNVSLNVKSGMIYGDAGLLSNVGKPGSIVNNKLQNSSIAINSTTGQVLLSATTLNLGDIAYLNVANLVTSVSDTSTSNIPSANVVNTVHKIATYANTVAVATQLRTNAVSDTVNAAFVLANTVNTIAVAALSDIANNFSIDATIFDTANNAYDKANAANVLAFNTGSGANTFLLAVIAGANTTVGVGANSFASGVGSNANLFASATIAGANAAVGSAANNFAGVMANAANAFMITVQNGSNTAVGTAANNFAGVMANAANAFMITVQNGSNTAVGTAANNYAGVMANAANAFMITVQNGSNTAVGAGANSVGTAAFAKANNSLANVSGQAGQLFIGNLTATGVFTDQFGNLRLSYSTTTAATARTLRRGDIANLVLMATNTSGTQSNTYIPEATFIAGDTIILYNNTSSAQTIRPNLAVVRVMLAGSATANSQVGATRNVEANGIVSLYCVAANTFVLTGLGAIE